MVNLSYELVHIFLLDYPDYMDNTDTHMERTEFRKIQPIHGNTTWILAIPKSFVSALRLEKGDYVKCTIVDDELRVRKANV